MATTAGLTLNPAQVSQVQMWITDAQMLIRIRADRERVDVASLDSSVVDYVVRQAVAALVKKPDAAKEVSVQVDDGQVSKKFESATGQIEITPEWWELLFPAGRGSSFSISLSHS
ncbi:hypothetical protein [Propionicimonas paludicola]|uniref:hypothetical protein n=1 Tax=Propionicimonas paludicola TaxID=185243 RepID=UPI001179D0B7|nr:hypothetical protein [Propionicimonas paludicola]